MRKRESRESKMAIYVVAIPKVEVRLEGKRSTIAVHLPEDYRSARIDDPAGRRRLEKRHADAPMWVRWIGEQLDAILKDDAGTGVLADPRYPMRSPGAGILPRISSGPASDDSNVILHIRGSNRGSVWPLGTDIAYPLTWKAFAGITGSADELEDPRRTAISELYEELSLIAGDKMLLPSDIHSYPEVLQQLETARKRINRHYRFNLSFCRGDYKAIELRDLEGDDNTQVEIVAPGGRRTAFNAIVSYDPLTNALDVSFLTTLRVQAPLTGLLSLSGPENDDVGLEPYMEDIVVVRQDDLIEARPGETVAATHLLSVHGPANYLRTRPGHLFYTPAPTLEPIVAYMRKGYSFRSVLEKARDRLENS